MELAIVAGLAAWGYLKTRAENTENTLENTTFATVPDLVESTQRLVQAPAAQNKLARPFFKSEKTQAYSETQAQRKLETFTGALDQAAGQTGAWSQKRESRAPAPKPDGIVTSSGVALRGDAYTGLTERVAPTGLTDRQHNVGPAGTRQYVGPGLGAPPTAPTGDDGLHPMFRVMPPNVNGYRRHVLPGRFGGLGLPVVPKGTAAQGLGELTKAAKQKAWAHSAGLVPSRAGMDLPTGRPDTYVHPTRRQIENRGPGPATFAAGGLRPRSDVTEPRAERGGVSRPTGPASRADAGMRPRNADETHVMIDPTVEGRVAGGVSTGLEARTALPAAGLVLRSVQRTHASRAGHAYTGTGGHAGLGDVSKTRQSLREPGIVGGQTAVGAIRGPVPGLVAVDPAGRDAAGRPMTAAQWPKGPVDPAARLDHGRDVVNDVPRPREQTAAGAFLGGALGQQTTTYNKLPTHNPRAPTN